MQTFHEEYSGPNGHFTNVRVHFTQPSRISILLKRTFVIPLYYESILEQLLLHDIKTNCNRSYRQEK